MKIFKFLVSKVFFLNLLIALLLLVGGYLYLNNYLMNVTQHGQKVEVPSFLKSKVSDLDDIFEENSFRYEIMDSIWERKLPKGIVLDQKPAPGDSVKDGRKIYLTINARTDKMVKLSIKEMIGGASHAREAIDYLITNDLLHDSTILVSGEFDGMILGFVDSKGRTLKDGDLVKAGSKISIKVSHTEGEEIRTPKVKGMNLKSAVRTLKNVLLNVTIMEKGDGACIDGLDSLTARVYMQRPECGESIKVGKEVSLFYTCDTTFVISNSCK